MEIEDIRKHYEKMSDSQFILILTTKAHGIRPEVFAIIEKEIEKRNLNPNLLEGVLAQNKQYSFEEIESYSKLIRELACPFCGAKNSKLNGTFLHTVKSFILLTSSLAEVIIACPDCLDKKNNNAMISTAFLGWWSIPWGFLKTPLYIYRNYKEKKENRLKESNNALIAFVLEHIGEIEAYKDDKEQLQYIIKPQ